jgi:hypothetical protein
MIGSRQAALERAYDGAIPEHLKLDVEALAHRHVAEARAARDFARNRVIACLRYARQHRAQGRPDLIALVLRDGQDYRACFRRANRRWHSLVLGLTAEQERHRFAPRGAGDLRNSAAARLRRLPAEISRAEAILANAPTAFLRGHAMAALLALRTEQATLLPVAGPSASIPFATERPRPDDSFVSALRNAARAVDNPITE